MRNKRLIRIVLVVLLALPPIIVHAGPNVAQHIAANDEGAQLPRAEGNIESKEEVVYANLRASGEVDELYVVNILDVIEEGTVVDYGAYTRVRNLTDLTDLVMEENAVHIDAGEGTFYYQGNLETNALPWEITVSYYLDGEEIAPEDLPGKNGAFELFIETRANEQVDPLFYDNYMLQITVTLDTDIAEHVQATDATIANVGKQKQITFTVMAEQLGELYLQADVQDFEMDGIEIAAIPPAMAIEAPENELTQEMQTLSDAIEELNSGIAELRDGARELHDVTHDLQDGSAQFKEGTGELSRSSGDLVDASETIQMTLETMSRELAEQSLDVDSAAFAELAEALAAFADGVQEAVDGLRELDEHYTWALSVLDQVIKDIPAHDITDEQIQQLYTSGADIEIVDQLLESYSASLVVKGTYEEVQEAFTAVDHNLPQIAASVEEMAEALTVMANELSASIEEMDAGLEQLDSFALLQEGLHELSTHYDAFHSGIVDYTGGVSELSDSYASLHSGITELAEGTAQFVDGAGELEDGSHELMEETNDLPEQVEAEVDQMIADYNKSDLDVISFVSPKNEEVNRVQFVMQTESVSAEEEEIKTEEEEQEEGFWQRLRNLFR